MRSAESVARDGGTSFSVDLDRYYGASTPLVAHQRGELISAGGVCYRSHVCRFYASSKFFFKFLRLLALQNVAGSIALRDETKLHFNNTSAKSQSALNWKCYCY